MSEKLLAAGSVTLMAAGSLLGASSASALTVADCGTHPGASVSLVNGSICQVVYDTVGEHSFTPPAGITAFEAILIGGGAGSGKSTITENPDYLEETAGYGGWPEHYLYEDVSGEYDLYVGDGGTFEQRVDTGGDPVYTGGIDGEDTWLGDPLEEFSDGAEDTVPLVDSAMYGMGHALSDVASGDLGEENPLWPAADGGILFATIGTVVDAAGCPSQSYGSGGSVCGTTYEDGASGAVIIRWALSAKLASTGVDASAIGIGAGALLAGGVALGAVAAVRRARAKN